MLLSQPKFAKIIHFVLTEFVRQPSCLTKGGDVSKHAKASGRLKSFPLSRPRPSMDGWLQKSSSPPFTKQKIAQGSSCRVYTYTLCTVYTCKLDKYNVLSSIVPAIVCKVNCTVLCSRFGKTQ